MTTEREYDSYQMSVAATWDEGVIDRTVTVYGVRGDEIPDVVAKGRCRLGKRFGEPFEIRVEGFRPGNDWDKLNGGMSPGEWVCTAVPVN